MGKQKSVSRQPSLNSSVEHSHVASHKDENTFTSKPFLFGFFAGVVCVGAVLAFAYFGERPSRIGTTEFSKRQYPPTHGAYTDDQLLLAKEQFDSGAKFEAVQLLKRESAKDPYNCAYVFWTGFSLLDLANTVDAAFLEDALTSFDTVGELSKSWHCEFSEEAMNEAGLIRLLYHRDAQAAVANFKMAIAFAEEKRRFDFWEPHRNLGLAYELDDDIASAVAAFKACLRKRSDPGLKLHSGTLLPHMYQSSAAMMRGLSSFGHNVRGLMEKPGIRVSEPFDSLMHVPHRPLSFLGVSLRRTAKEVSSLMLSASPSLQYTAPFVGAINAHSGAKRSYVTGMIDELEHRLKRKLKVGFVSSHLRSHPVGFLMKGVITRLDRQRFNVTVFDVDVSATAAHKVDLRPDTFSRPAGGGGEDAIAQAIGSSADQVVNLTATSLDGLRQVIASAEMDALVFCDVTLHPTHYLLAFSRLAPVQFHSLGHPDTSGVPTLDYAVSYRILEPPEAGRYYTEPLVTLGGLPYLEWPEKPSMVYTRAQLELASGDHLYTVAQALPKILPDFDSVLKEILVRDSKATIVLKQHFGRRLDDKFADRIRQSLGPVLSQRVVMLDGLDYDQWISLLHHTTVILDTFPFSTLSVSVEAIGLSGTPIVTLPFPRFYGMGTSALYRTMGIEDCCVAHNQTHYTALALRMGMNETAREEAHERIVAARGKIFQHTEAVREWERLLSDACTGRAIANLQPSFEGDDEVDARWSDRPFTESMAWSSPDGKLDPESFGTLPSAGLPHLP